MRSITLIIILTISLTNCGFKPIYNSKNSNFQIVEIKNKNENKNSFFIENIIMALSNNDALKKLKLEIDYDQSITTILKDNKGDPSKKKISIIVNLNENLMKSLTMMYKVINSICLNMRTTL